MAKVNIGTYRVRGLYNDSKSRVLVTLYVYKYWRGINSLTVTELAVASHNKIRYLQLRLPVFAGKARYRPTGKLWDDKRLLVVRSASERQGRPVFVYGLSSYGRTVVEDKMSRDVFWEYVNKLGLIDFRPK